MGKSLDKDVAKKVAVISGGASGMGWVFALRMAAQGFHVHILDWKLEAVASQVAANEALTAHQVDVTDAAAIQAVLNGMGTVERVVCCAAIMPTDVLSKQAADVSTRIMAVNYGGTVNLVRAILPDMLARDAGEVIIFGSAGGAVFMPECGAYCASKAATNAYAEILIDENRSSNVRIMLVCPSLVNTPLLEQAAQTSNPAVVQSARKSGHYATPEKIIDAVEMGLSKGAKVLKPGEAAFMMWLARFSPGLTRLIIRQGARI